MTLRACLGEDYLTHGACLTSAGFRALAMYRFGVWRASRRPGLVRKLLRIPYVALHRRVRNRHRIELHYSAKIGRRVRLSDLGDIVVGNQVAIGDGCTIGHGVTIGKTRNDAVGWPEIGSRVTIGPGAVIVGSLTIGDGAVIGPNSVVLASIPAGGVAWPRPSEVTTDAADTCDESASRPDRTGSKARFPSGRMEWHHGSM